MKGQWLMEMGVVQAMMQFGRGCFQVGWEQSEAPRHPSQNYKEDKRAAAYRSNIPLESVCRYVECHR
jgi:hypothetical protein